MRLRRKPQNIKKHQNHHKYFININNKCTNSLSFSFFYFVKVSECLPDIIHRPQYLFSRFPKRVTSMWNFINLFTPTSWICILLSMAAVSIFCKISVSIGSKFGLKTNRDYLVLFPFRYRCAFQKVTL